MMNKSLTQEQREILAEYDASEQLLELKLKQLRERRREFINTNQLNDKVGVK